MGRITTPALSRKQIAILTSLKRSPGQVVELSSIEADTGIPSASVGKRMMELRRVAFALGYEIESVYGRGYRLVAWPDEEVPV